jgi:cob(I)alamin adenosyltransferase
MTRATPGTLRPGPDFSVVSRPQALPQGGRDAGAEPLPSAVTLGRMVNLTRIYTRTGDAGQTRLGDMSLTTKTDPRLAAYADVDEANAHLGLALVQGRLDPEVVTLLTRVQNDLFDVGADFCTPVVAPDDPAQPEYAPLRIEQSYVDRLEAWCDAYNEDLPALRSFILNGGTEGAALLHVARTVVRRAERSAWGAYEVHADSMNVLAITYLNRLSDLLFILARHANREHGDVLWVPGGERD